MTSWEWFGQKIYVMGVCHLGEQIFLLRDTSKISVYLPPCITLNEINNFDSKGRMKCIKKSRSYIQFVCILVCCMTLLSELGRYQRKLSLEDCKDIHVACNGTNYTLHLVCQGYLVSW